MFRPAGDTIIVEKLKDDSLLALPDSIEFSEEDIFVVKDVGVGYVTEQGVVIPPEVKAGDRCIIKGKVLRLMIKGEELLLARAQDVIAFERGENA
jgi:co-chaperonin GroES (HSP10)